MKKLFLILALTLISLPVFAQSDNIDTIVTSKTYWKGKLTSAIDTVSVSFGTPERFNTYTISAKSDGADTLHVYTLNRDGSGWTQRRVFDQLNNVSVSELPVNSVYNEFFLFDTQPYKIRVISTSNDASYDTVIVTGKYGIPLSNVPSTIDLAGNDSVLTHSNWSVTSETATIAASASASDTLTVPARSHLIALVFNHLAGSGAWTIAANLNVGYTSRTSLSRLFPIAGTELAIVVDSTKTNTTYLPEFEAIKAIRYFSVITTAPATTAQTITAIYKRD